MATTVIHARGRNDDGSESTATWKAPEDQDWTQAVDQNFRVRFSVQNDTAAINNLDVQLQYNLNGAGWVNVTGTSNVVRSSASANVADAANLTQQLTAGTGAFEGATAFDEVNGICGGASYDIAATEHFEHEFCCQLRSADVVRGDKIQLRTINSDTGTPWTTYNVIPTMTAIGVNINVGEDLGAMADAHTVTLSEPAVTVLTPNVNDSVTVVEFAHIPINIPTQADSVAAAEFVHVPINIPTQSESIIAWDLSNQEINYWITVTDAIQPMLLIQPQPFEEVTVAENITVSISAGAPTQLTTDQFDPVTVAENITPHLLVQPQRDDAVTVADAPTINLLEQPNTFDAVAVAEFAIGSPVLQPQPFETVNIAEDITPRLFILPQHFDAVGAAENIEVFLHKLFVDQGDDVTVSESVIVSTGVISTLPIDTFDSVAAGELPTVFLPKLPIIIDDPVTIADAIVSRVPFLGVTTSDAVTITERVATSRVSKPLKGMTKTQWQAVWNDNINQINARFGMSLNNVGATGWGTTLNNNFATLNSTFGLSLVQPATGTTDWDVILNANLDAINAGLPW